MNKYIKREDAMRLALWLGTNADRRPVTHIKRMVMGIPAADVIERKHGRWILSEDQDEIEVANGNFRFKCSNCGASDIHSKRTRVRYCWNCGSDMKGESNE